MQYIIIHFSVRMNQNHTRILHIVFESIAAAADNVNHQTIINLYPYESLKLKSFFMYGNDHGRRSASMILSALMNYWFIPFWFAFTTTVLHLIRFKVNDDTPDISSSILDMIAIFFGGKSIRFRHCVEKAFIIILLFGMFFISSLFVGDFLSKASVIRPVREFDRFEKVVDLKTPIYFADFLGDERRAADEILRYHFSFDFLFSFFSLFFWGNNNIKFVHLVNKNIVGKNLEKESTSRDRYSQQS